LRSTPLNVDLHLTEPRRRARARDISHALSAHPGPGRRFYIRYGDRYGPRIAATLDGWLRSPALDSLQKLDILLFDQGLIFNHGLRRWVTKPMPLPLPASALCFSSTLRIASFGECVFPDAQAALHWPLLKQLTLSNVTVLESSLHAWLAGCHALESLLLHGSKGFSRLRIVSPSLRSIGVGSRTGDPKLQQLLIEDAPCLERLLVIERMEIGISVVSAPRLGILGKLLGNCHTLQFATTTLQVYMYP
jgi:hypothetical protein